MRRWHWIVITALVAASVVAERFVDHKHDYWFFEVPGYFVLYGFIGCVAIIYLSKWYGRYGVQRSEDYYRRHSDDDEHRALTEPTADAAERRAGDAEPAAAERRDPTPGEEGPP